MQCPHCGYDKHKVIDSRDRGEAIRRRRQCLSCEQRFTTYEHVAPGLLVSKRDGHREPFDRQKLLAGIRIAAVKRPISSERMKSIANLVEDRIQRLGRAEVTSEMIGQSGVGPTGGCRSGCLYPFRKRLSRFQRSERNPVRG